jgi:hypothetical protein
MAYQFLAKLSGLNLTQDIMPEPKSFEGVMDSRKPFTLTKNIII